MHASSYLSYLLRSARDTPACEGIEAEPSRGDRSRRGSPRPPRRFTPRPLREIHSPGPMAPAP